MPRTLEPSAPVHSLRDGVVRAIEILGHGFLRHPANAPLIARLESSRLSPEDFSRQLQRLVFRLLFLHIAEDAGLLHTPPPDSPALRPAHALAREKYAQRHSMRALADRARHLAEQAPSPNPDDADDLYPGLLRVFDALAATGHADLALPALGSAFWQPTFIPDLVAPARLHNRDLLPALASLQWHGRPAHDPKWHGRLAHDSPVRISPLGAIYESLLALHPRLDLNARTFSFSDAGRERKATGSYYTPDSLVQCLLDSALEPAIAQATAGKTGQTACEALLNLTVCDPACGAGHFLIAAAHRLARRLARLRTSRDIPADTQRALRDVIARCIHGIDLNPMAVELCRIALWLEAAEPGKPLTVFDGRIQRGNALLDDSPRRFDVIIGNPPFVNVIEGGIDDATKARARQAHPGLTGTADLAFIFFSQCNKMRAPNGWVGLVQPRALLNARSVARLRAQLTKNRQIRLVFASSRPDFFPGAAVYISLVALGPPGLARIGLAPDPSSATWHVQPIKSPNWWAEAQRIAAGSAHDDRPRGLCVIDAFEVSASMTAGDAYDVAPFIIDDANAPGLRLVTTGLIEPGHCLWGARACRYLKKDYRHPIVAAADDMTPSLRRRIARSRRPKILVAGLSRRIECFLDPAGQYIGAVSTFSIHHPADDIHALEKLCALLLAPAASERFRVELGGNAMGGGNTTMKRHFLEDFPLGSATKHTEPTEKVI